jgi:Ca2+-binding RTX toxin-like protein
MMMKRTLLVLTAILAALMLSSGMALAATITCQAGVDCLGTRKADDLKGTAGKDHIYGRRGGDILRGLGEFDELHGQSGKDRLFGGPEVDFLIGGPGNDALGGGGDDDWYFFGDNWGKDTITDDATSANSILMRDIGTGTPFVTDNLIIDLRTSEEPEVQNVSGTSTIDWEGNAINEVDGGAGDDEITGNELANMLFGGPGEDTLFGRGGDDEIIAMDGSPDDTVDCGEDLIGGPDHDFALHDPGDTIIDCEDTSTQP